VVVNILMIEGSIDKQLWGLLEGKRGVARDLMEDRDGANNVQQAILSQQKS
jgi:hypothetical protein